MASESGGMKLLGNFTRLIELVSVNPDYNPANLSLKVPALNAQKTAASTAISNVGAQPAPFKSAVNGRQAGRTYAAAGEICNDSGCICSGAGEKRNDGRLTMQVRYCATCGLFVLSGGL